MPYVSTQRLAATGSEAGAVGILALTLVAAGAVLVALRLRRVQR